MEIRTPRAQAEALSDAGDYQGAMHILASIGYDLDARTRWLALRYGWPHFIAANAAVIAQEATAPAEPVADIVEIRPGRHFSVEFVVECTCGFRSNPIWYRDIAEGRLRGHEIIHTREGL